MKERGKAQCFGHAQTITDRHGQLVRNRLGVAWQVVLGMSGDVGGGIHDLERVVEHVEVVEAALLHAAGRAEFRQDHIDQAKFVEHPQTGRGVVEPHQPPHFHVHPLSGRAVGQERTIARQCRGAGIDPKAEFVREPAEPHEPEWIVVEGVVGHDPQNTVCEIALPIERVDDRSAVQRHRHRIDGEIPVAHVLGDRAAARSDVHGEVVEADPPRPVALGQRKG